MRSGFYVILQHTIKRSHPNQAASDSENDEANSSDDSFIEAARTLVSISNLDLSEIPGLQGRNNQTGMNTLNLSVNPPARDPPPPSSKN